MPIPQFSDPRFRRELQNSVLFGLALFFGFMLINHYSLDNPIAQQDHIRNFLFWVGLGIVLGLVKYFLTPNQNTKS
ncbi:MAG: hypothetical protein Q4F57_00715 [Weeksellaceae bacterium]|nr:hypothetical protein [Weeksellaceae bacterium]